MQIVIDTSVPLSETDIQLLCHFLAPHLPRDTRLTEGATASSEEITEEPTPAPKKRAARKKAEPKPAESEQETLPGPEETPFDSLPEMPLQDAVIDAATALMAAGKAAQVRDALATQGVKRVSELPDDAARQGFLDALGFEG